MLHKAGSHHHAHSKTRQQIHQQTWQAPCDARVERAAEGRNSLGDVSHGTSGFQARRCEIHLLMWRMLCRIYIGLRSDLPIALLQLYG
eukprot:758322-Rhodomonas_salina.2